MFRAGRMSGWMGAVVWSALGWSGVALGQTGTPGVAKATVPDAQVEASVLKSLAGSPDLANQSITTTTVYGVVTLSGTVQTEAQRTEAENLAARTPGVQKVVDEMTLPSEANVQPLQPEAGAASLPDSQQQPDAQGSNPDLQSDGTTPPGGQNPEASEPGNAAGPSYGPGAPEYRQPYGGQQQPQGPYGQAGPPPAYPQQGQPGYPGQGQPGYSQQGQPAYPQQAYPQQGQQSYYGAPAYAGQQAGEIVTIPSGALVRMRINQTLDSARAQQGQRFDGIVVNDVVAGGAVAIPRGAAVQGVVVDARKSGVLAGRGELSLQLTEVTLGGKAYPIVSDVWAHNGADKTVQSVGSAAIGGGIGALFGAVAGGGAGAAIGAGLGGALGLGSSAASHSGQVYVPAEGLLTFHLSQPVTVTTVSQQEMDRLAQNAGPAYGGPQRLQRRYPYYGPGYYRPYPPYPYGYPYPY